MSEFVRHQKYCVAKFSDMDKYLDLYEKRKLLTLMMKIENGRQNDDKANPDFVCIPSTWSEQYKAAWKLVEEKVMGNEMDKNALASQSGADGTGGAGGVGDVGSTGAKMELSAEGIGIGYGVNSDSEVLRIDPSKLVSYNLYARQQVSIQVKAVDQDFLEKFGAPCYTKPDDAGLDIRANLLPLLGKEGLEFVDGKLLIHPGQTILIPTGFAFYLQNPNFVGCLMPRSGLGHKHGLVLGNLTGVIDASYQGQLMVSMWNRSNEPYYIEHGERIAQYLIMPVFGASIAMVDEFRETTNRGSSGFGASGSM